MSNTIIKLENISKQYRIGTVGRQSLKGDSQRWWYNLRGKEDPTLKIGSSNQLDTQEGEYVWALRDINLEVKQGEVLGIIGKNGAGKSTLLKLLSRVTGPTTGQIKVKGRIASLLEVGTGFHPELTGKENIFLNGAILGMTKPEIRSKFDEIVDFAGVAKYIDTPVKRYSSGMYVRLAFAVAAHLEPDILVVDEVLAVGDAEFQKKAIGKMQDVSTKGGRTVLFVSHNMGSIKALCDEVVILKNGKLVHKGDTDSSIGYYLSEGIGDTVEGRTLVEKVYNKGIVIKYFKVLDKKRRESSRFTNLEDIKIELSFELIEKIDNLKIAVTITDQSGVEVLTTFHNDIQELKMKSGVNTFSVVIPKNTLNKGSYFISLYIGIHQVKWIVKEEKVASFIVDFVIPNKNLLQANKRRSVIAPLLHWQLND
jgi:lipopolysaccharide transport system ATP-binding protein